MSLLQTAAHSKEESKLFKLPGTTMTELEARIALNMLEHLGPIRLRRLLDRFGDARNILKANETDLSKVDGLGPATIRSITKWESTVQLQAELDRIRESGCQVLIPEDEAYPRYLKEIHDPPIVLYVKGNLIQADHHGIALVGSRQITAYGDAMARRLSGQLARAGVTVVSGGAVGIDTAAHHGALAQGGRTLAVLGTGINRVYPAENVELFSRMAEDRGAVLTQFPFNRKGDRQSFPIRNRIVAGMTLATVVIEANRTSGSLITADFAADYGRPVLAVPGRIDSPRSAGCHALLKRGARLCEGVEDILEEMEYLLPSVGLQPSAESGQVQRPLPELDARESTVLQALPPSGPIHLDHLIQASGLPAGQIQVALLQLEMKRLVRQLPGKFFERFQ